MQKHMQLVLQLYADNNITNFLLMSNNAADKQTNNETTLSQTTN